MNPRNLLMLPGLAVVLMQAMPVLNAQDLHLSLDGLAACYDFEQTGTAGLANKAPGATTHHGTYLGDVSLIAGAGAGFSGDAAYPGAVSTNTTARSTPARCSRSTTLANPARR